MVVVIFVLEIVAGILAFVFRSDVSIYASDIFDIINDSFWINKI